MGSLRNHNPNQFQLFMTGNELQNKVNLSYDREGGESMSNMWDRKAQESKKPEPPTSKKWTEADHGAGIYDSLKSMGYRGESLELSHVGEHYDERRDEELDNGVRVEDGHHRIAAAAALENETGKQVFIPVEHFDHTLPWRLKRDADSVNRTFGKK